MKIKLLCIVFLIYLFSCIVTSATINYPTDSDNFTELTTTGWSSSVGSSTITLNTTDSQIGNNSIQFNSAEAGVKRITYDLIDGDYSEYDRFIFYIWSNKPLTWRATYSVFFNNAGTERFSLTGTITQNNTWTQYTLNKSDMSSGNFSDVELITCDWDSDEHPLIVKIDGVHFEKESNTPVISNTNVVNTSYENTDQVFSFDCDQTVNVSWKINGTEYQTNTSITSASYINSTALNGSYNVTAIVTNANGSSQYSWTMTRLLPTWDNIVDESNSTYIRFTLSNYTEGVQINSVIWGNQTNGTDSTYTLKWYSNDTTMATNSTVDNNNVTLFYNDILEGTYYIIETSNVSTSTLTIPANSWGIFNNWTTQTTFAAIAANESNDQCLVHYNVTNGIWESYYVGYNWNSDYPISQDDGCMIYVDAETNIVSQYITPTNTSLKEGWNMLALQGTSNKTISEITADMRYSP